MNTMKKIEKLLSGGKSPKDVIGMGFASKSLATSPVNSAAQTS